MTILSFIIILAPLIWCGMLAGISFIEAPLKFRAPGITIPLGLGIGRLVFHALNRVEWFFFILWIACLFVYPAGNMPTHTYLYPLTIFAPITVGAILVAQTIWLLPHLDRRAQQLRQGITPTGKSLHFYYAAAELAKCLLLVSYAITIITNYK